MVWVAIALGILEGITEFVPVSSTGHLILASSWLELPEKKKAAFEIFIQLGAVFAVLWFYRAKLLTLVAALPRDHHARAFVAKIALAFFPAAVVGLLLHDWIVDVLFGPLPVAAALAFGGALLIAIDRPERAAAITRDMEQVSWGQAFGIGC